ncbi:MAG TPA: hypothetical protein VN736_05460 [Candidatus Limnocylindrales bacterium]|nr:hypothetical protein [Candidatus Limnocylindrales bacterium]
MLPLAAAAVAQTPPEIRARVEALSKTVLRDSAELPMDVAVTREITDAAGKIKSRATSHVKFLFHGFNPRNDTFKMNASAGLMSRRLMYDSMAGDVAFFVALSNLAPRQGDENRFDVKPGPDGHGFLIQTVRPECHDFVLSSNLLFPRNFCGSVDLFASADGEGKLQIDRFVLEVRGLPRPGQVRYIGATRVTAFRAEGETQSVHIGSDPQPYFVPKRAVTRVITEKGAVVLTNIYSVVPPGKR